MEKKLLFRTYFKSGFFNEPPKAIATVVIGDDAINQSEFLDFAVTASRQVLLF